MNKKRLTFEHEQDKWYIYLPMYPGPKHNLLMVAGADDMLDFIHRNHADMKYVSMDVYTGDTPTELEHCIGCERTEYSLFGGATYKTFGEECIANNGSRVDTIWLCPVTLVVYQKYPKCIQIDLNSLSWGDTPDSPLIDGIE